jgi:ubiquitin-activating enzyme E1
MADEAVDEGLYSRQLYVMGHEAQRKMAASNLLISGMNGLGVEIAKNVILAGVKSVVLHDHKDTTLNDLSAQFYLQESDVGTNRAKACAHKLGELNQYVPVSASDEELSHDFLARFQCVVMVDTPQSQQVQINDFCHSRGIAFISSDVRGVFGNIFCDFGDSFVVSDTNGEQPLTCMVSSVTKENPGVVTVTDDTRHGLETGDYVTFREVEGMDELNSGEPRMVTVLGPYTFSIEDTSSYGDYKLGGYADQVKQPKTLHFNSLQESLKNPGEFLESDFAKFGRPPVLHQAFRALAEFQTSHGGALPAPGNVEQTAEFIRIVTECNNAAADGEVKVDKLEEHSKLLAQFASGSSGVISPMCAFFGGIVGQEVLKACSGKFTPIQQWFYFDSAESLPDEPLPAEEYQPLGCRYDSQIAVFGKTFQGKLNDLNYFLVGAGAIGCEMLKNWAMMGIASGEKGQIHITDMDGIEKSNLSRQFLFRPADIKKMKSDTAAQAIGAMNPDTKVTPLQEKVGADTENLFNDEFYSNLDGIITALDNVDARLYMDQRALFYQLPFFDSGTLGTKGNTQVVVPKLTENYGASRDPPEKSIPICTLKNFPNQIEHTLQWARDWFEGEFNQASSDVNNYLGNPDFMKQLNAQQNTKLETLERIKKSLMTERPLSFDECIVWARNNFEFMYINDIKQLLHNFPVDQQTSTGTPFWSGTKRAPHPFAFDASDPLHMEFIIAGANLRAENYGLTGRFDAAYFEGILPTVIVPDFVPKSGVKIHANEKEAKEAAEAAKDVNMMDVDELCDNLVKELPTVSSLAGYRMHVVEFEKDDDAHMRMITACSNLRARVYKIQEADMHKSRQIAGKIIPAIATTTALVTGLVCLELYKTLQDAALEKYKNGFVNLAIPLFAFSEPVAPASTKAMIKGKEWNWSVWDCIDIDRGDMNMAEFIAFFDEEYGLEVQMISYGVSILYSFFSSKAKMKERMTKPMTEVVTMVTKKGWEPGLRYIIFEVCVCDEEGEDVEIPYVRYKVRL